MRQVVLARRAREAHFDSLDDAGRAVRGHQRRLIPTSSCPDTRRHRFDIFLDLRHQIQRRGGGPHL
jgi:hypothetical protein